MSADGAENVPDWSKIFLKSFPAAERVLGSLNNEDMAACLEVCAGWRKVAITMIGMKTAQQKVGALLWACRKEKPDYAEVLLACGADKKTAYEMPLFAKVFLANKTADPQVANRNGWTPLHVAAFNGNSKVAKVLLTHGANVDKAGPEGKWKWKRTPLLVACNRVMTR